VSGPPAGRALADPTARVELGELLRAARLAVACGGTSHPGRRDRLLGELSRAHLPASPAQARRLARALGQAARLATADHAAGLLPAGLGDPGGLAARLLAARAALRPAAHPPTGRPARVAQGVGG
jgi:hypothetical protein